MKKIVTIYKEGFYISLRLLYFYIISVMILALALSCFAIVIYLFSLCHINLDWFEDYISIIVLFLIPPVLYYASKITGEFIEEQQKRETKLAQLDDPQSLA